MVNGQLSVAVNLPITTMVPGRLMPSLTLSNQLIWFAHCPKAGGTSVEQFMVAQWGDAVGHLHWGWDLWWKGGGWRVADPPNSPQHLTWEDALKILPSAPDHIFAVVRDPVTRLQSEYRWQRQGRRGTWAGKVLALLPFSFWLPLMLALVQQHPHAFDNHLRPHSDFIPEGAELFYLEDGLVPVLRWLTDMGGIPEENNVPHAIPTGQDAKVEAKEQALIAEVFARDYERFSYPFPNTKKHRVGFINICARGLAPALAYLDRRGAL
jgi:hypothetical protein